jgi:hypothetical protein
MKDPLAERLIFGFQERDLQDTLISSAAGQREKQELVNPSHGDMLQA